MALWYLTATLNTVGCVLSPTLAQTQKHIMHISTANIQELKLNSMSMYTHTQRKVFQSFVKSALQLRKHGFQSMYMHIHVYTCTDVCMWHLTLLDIKILITICKCTETPGAILLVLLQNYKFRDGQ